MRTDTFFVYDVCSRSEVKLLPYYFILFKLFGYKFRHLKRINMRPKMKETFVRHRHRSQGHQSFIQITKSGFVEIQQCAVSIHLSGTDL